MHEGRVQSCKRRSQNRTPRTRCALSQTPYPTIGTLKGADWEVSG